MLCLAKLVTRLARSRTSLVKARTRSLTISWGKQFWNIGARNRKSKRWKSSVKRNNCLFLTDPWSEFHISVPTRTSSVLYPSSVASIIVLFVILAFLLCFVIRLFSKTRCRHRLVLISPEIWKLCQQIRIVLSPGKAAFYFQKIKFRNL